VKTDAFAAVIAACVPWGRRAAALCLAIVLVSAGSLSGKT